MTPDTPIDARYHLATIRELVKTGKMEAAQEGINDLLQSIDLDVLTDVQDEIRTLISMFYPKRKRDITQVLNKRLLDVANEFVSPVYSDVVISKEEITEPSDNNDRWDSSVQHLRSLYEDMIFGFTDLSARHIFQWATFYRDFVGHILERALDLYSTTAKERLLHIIKNGFADHAAEIFSKGYSYVQTYEFMEGRNYPIIKSLNGLQRFLELPIDFYSARVSRIAASEQARALRQICSAMMSGILQGYGETVLGDLRGWQLLPRYPRSWIHFAGFLTLDDLQSLLIHMEPGELGDGLKDAMLPVARALDELGDPKQNSFALPVLGEFSWDIRRLTVALLPTSQSQRSRYVEIHSYLNLSFVSQRSLEEANNRGIAVIVAFLRPDLHEWVESHSELRSTVVNTAAEGASFDQQVERILQLLEYSIALGSTEADVIVPIRYNFARDFPLNKPQLTPYFHVYRTSVRQLLQTFERRNGVRLWCSVRRSGKTTACFDLSTTTGLSSVVSQTCGTHTDAHAGLFYSKVIDAVLSGKDIRDTFFSDIVSVCAGNSVRESQRFVFVLDEYETLFGRLQLAAKRNKELRYTVVQPLLNQMVSFGAENLIVFIGQQLSSSLRRHTQINTQNSL